MAPKVHTHFIISCSRTKGTIPHLLLSQGHSRTPDKKSSDCLSEAMEKTSTCLSQDSTENWHFTVNIRKSPSTHSILFPRARRVRVEVHSRGKICRMKTRGVPLPPKSSSHAPRGQRPGPAHTGRLYTSHF